MRFAAPIFVRWYCYKMCGIVLPGTALIGMRPKTKGMGDRTREFEKPGGEVFSKA